VTPERWGQVREILHKAILLTSVERPVYLDQACSGDFDLRSEVESLLQSHEKADSVFLKKPAIDWEIPGRESEPRPNLVGLRVGVYQLVEEIGHGGMGEVYRAVRADGQYTKEVAVKLVHGGSSVLLERFRHERQILATLEHSNIARLLDGGTTDPGVPYLVMELIEGTRIDQYCEQNKLSVHNRLRMFLQVCDAVQFAHQRLIIHRDIKPGNILVTREGVPKLLDFGIAKILETSPETGQADSTLTLLRLLTPQYASPEQIRGEPITTASDVYSLGVVLYELLTGRSPYPTVTRGPHEAARAACECEPLKPSTAVVSGRRPKDGSGDQGRAKIQSSVAPDKLAKRLKGDLDNIVLKALRKEPQRRYGSVEQFAEDIRRTLAHLPILARRDTARYRAAKFIQRHKAGVAAAVTIVATLVVGLIITLREASIAERRFNDVRTLANSLIFDVHDSITNLPGSTPARKIIVDRALQYLNGLARESGGDITLQRELATAYEKVGKVQGDWLQNNLGDTQGALASYERALEIRKQVDLHSKDWSDHLALAQAYRLAADQRWVTGDVSGARDRINRALAISEALNAAHPNHPKVLYELGFDYEVSGDVKYPGDPVEHHKVISDYGKALETDEAALRIQPDDVPTLHGYAVSLNNVGGLLEPTDPRAALSYFDRALEVNRKLTQRSTEIQYMRSMAVSYSDIADAYADLGDFAREADSNRRGLAIYQELNRADPKNALLRQGLAIAYANTASALSRAGDAKGSLDYVNKGVEIMRGLVASAPQNRKQQSILAAMLAAQGTVLIAVKQPGRAMDPLGEARSTYESLSRVADPHTEAAACDVKLGEAAAEAGQNQTAASYFRRALGIVEPLIGGPDPDLDALYAAADAYSGMGDLSLREAGHSGAAAPQRTRELTEARAWYEKSLSAWRHIQHPNRFTPSGFQASDPMSVARKLRQTKTALKGAFTSGGNLLLLLYDCAALGRVSDC
jgi:serine/threonine protein kinase